MQHRFWTEIYNGAKLFYISGMVRCFPCTLVTQAVASEKQCVASRSQVHGRYNKRDTQNLARFISIAKARTYAYHRTPCSSDIGASCFRSWLGLATKQFRPLTWRVQHPYVLADRFEDLTPEERVRQDPLCDRRIALFGYLRGCNLKPGMHVHLAGVGDFALSEVSALPDPCPLPGATKRRSLDDRERLLYAPMSDVGRLTYDKDAMYVNLADHTVNFTRPEAAADDAPSRSLPHVDTPGVQMVRELQDTRMTLDEKLQQSNIQLFRSSAPDGERPRGDDASVGESDSSSSESEGEAWSDEDVEDAPAAATLAPAADGAARVRRRAVFASADEANESPSSSDSDSDEGDDDAYGDVTEGLGAASRWKEGLAQRAARLHTQLDLMVRMPQVALP